MPNSSDDKQPAAEAKEPYHWRRGLIILGAVVVAFGALALYAIWSDDHPSVPSKERQAATAIQECRDAVRQQLKSPKTADFGSEATSETGEFTYRVTGLVDAENSFGVPLRHTFVCNAYGLGGKTPGAAVSELKVVE